MPLPTLHAAARAVVDLFPEQIAPLQDLCEAVALLEAALERDSKSRSKRLKGTAGRKATINYDLIDAMLGRGDRVTEIAEASGASEMTIRNRRTKLRRETVATPTKKSTARKPRGKGRV